ncbi:hypothetical protein ACFORL_02610 [Legionella dresdenensis]|uniref:Uncharacterized protein n=1 Tax=Legionella dresdenensis TaxID=450200 RepID=A0ABV8CCD6_9GAMM
MTSVKTLKEITASECKYIKSYEKKGGKFALRETNTYDLSKLERITGDKLEEKLFCREDFIIPPDVHEFEPIQIKVGKLYIVYLPGSKDSFLLRINYIDRQNRQLKLFLNLEALKFPAIKFENLLPISLNLFYPDRTMSGQSISDIGMEHLCHAFALKQTITKLMLDEDISEDEKRNFFEHYLALKLNVREPRRAKQGRFIRDTEYFCSNPQVKPASAFEVAEKIVAIQLRDLSIGETEIIEVLNEFLDVNDKHVDKVNWGAVKWRLMTNLLNQKPLQEEFQDIGVLFDRAVIHMYMNSVRATPSPA